MLVVPETLKIAVVSAASIMCVLAIVVGGVFVVAFGSLMNHVSKQMSEGD